MNRGIKVLFSLLIIIIAFLAGVSSYFYFQNKNLSKNANEKKDETKSATTKKIDTSTLDTKTKDSATSSITEPAPLKDRPSSPAETYKVAEGDTLFSIASKFDTSWPKLMEVNGLEDANKVKIGETLIIPKNDQVSFNIDSEQAKELQEGVDTGKNKFRLDPVATAKSDSPPVYGLTTENSYEKKEIDINAGTAVVIATKNDKKYEINLTQPVTTGEKGIWAIENIKPTE